MIAVLGFLSDNRITRTGALMYLVLGIVILLIAMFAADNPILITIILGVILIAQGIMRLIYTDQI